MELKDNISISKDRHYTNSGKYLWTVPGERDHIYVGTFSELKERISEVQIIPQFAYYPDMYNTTAATIVNTTQIIRIMIRNTLKETCNRIRLARLAGDDKLKSQLKASLPCFTHSGIFIPRRNEGLIQPSFTYQLDCDRLPDPNRILQKIIEDPQLDILFASVSPSGNGLKGLLLLKDIMFLRESWPWENYKEAYHNATDEIERYFKKEYGVQIDTQMKAISQPFFLFHSPNLFIHPNLLSWI